MSLALISQRSMIHIELSVVRILELCSQGVILGHEARDPLHEILDEVSNIEEMFHLMLILSSPAPPDRQRPRDEINYDAKFELYENSGGVSNSRTAESNDSFDEVANSANVPGNAVSLFQFGPILELLDRVSCFL